MTPPVALNFADPAFVADPYPVYAALRVRTPLRWYEPSGLWLVSRHADVDGLLRDRRLGRVFTPYQPDDTYGPWNRVNVHSLLEMEPPDHTRLRRLVARPFTPRRVAALREPIRLLTDELLDVLDADGGGDLIAALAEPLPVGVIAELLGIPAADRPLLRPWSNAIVSLYELGHDAPTAARAVAAAREFAAYLRALAAERRRNPGADLFSALAVQSVEGDRLSDDELVATAVLLLNAGHEASVNVLGNGVFALLRNPRQMDRLRADRSLVPRGVEEAIRYDTPLSLFQRTVFEPVALHGRELQPGERVGLLLGSANRDPDAFVDPDRFDIGREPNPHVGFGAGIHYCLGAPLARLELAVALERFLARFPRIELAAHPEPRPSFQFRGYRSLDIRVAAR